MNRHQFIDHPNPGYHDSIFDVCETLHMAHIGSADVLTRNDCKLYVEWLRMRLNTWQTPQSGYDNAARDLIVNVLQEVEHAHASEGECPDVPRMDRLKTGGHSTTHVRVRRED